MANRPRSLSTGDVMRIRSLFPRTGLAQPQIQALQADRVREAVDAFVSSLPRLSEQDLISLNEAESSCPICLNQFHTIATEEEMALAMDSPATPVQALGVTKLHDCGHIFCRKDIINWLDQGRNSCPSCRHALVPGLPARLHVLGEPDLEDLQALEHGVIQAAGALPLTPEQASSLRSAIMLLTEGDGIEHFAPPDAAPQPDEHEREREDRSAFVGMYS
ncbi:RING domain-containing protein [Phanerochaete sordida]|uniref:RING domain-containing protein n=1 Tax=Phanerochaete sordida TaxID=48140 RepID=A0A9P3GLJ7_9APHY|nr:RING domain-containing protein [Phanerochaete sordida]